MPTKQEVITALCRLACEVREHLGNDDAKPLADCFCGESSGPHFRFDQAVIDFIDAAVREKMEARDLVKIECTTCGKQFIDPNGSKQPMPHTVAPRPPPLQPVRR